MIDTGGSISEYLRRRDEVLCQTSEGEWVPFGWMEPGSIVFGSKPEPPLTDDQYAEFMRWRSG